MSRRPSGYGPDVALCIVGALLVVASLWVIYDQGYAAKAPLNCYALAHRGVHNSTIDENTEDAAAAAGPLHAWLDADLRMSSDSVGFMMHDRTVDRTTDGTGRIEDHTAAWVGQLHTTITGSRVPTWSQYLAAAGETPIVVELKKDVSDWTDGQILSVVSQAAGHTVYFGGTPSITKRLGELAPAALLYWRPDVGDTITVQAAADRSVDLVLAQPDAWTRKQVTVLKAAGYLVGARVSDQDTDWAASYAEGVTMMTTNRVRLLNAWCRGQS